MGSRVWYSFQPLKELIEFHFPDLHDTSKMVSDWSSIENLTGMCRRTIRRAFLSGKISEQMVDRLCVGFDRHPAEFYPDWPRERRKNGDDRQ